MRRFRCPDCGYRLTTPRRCSPCQRRRDETSTTECVCYDPVSMEYGPNYPCARCRMQEAAS